MRLPEGVHAVDGVEAAGSPCGPVSGGTSSISSTSEPGTLNATVVSPSRQDSSNPSVSR